MKLVIEIDDELYLQSYLSILSIGILECLEKNIINYDDAMNILYFQGMIKEFEQLFPELGEAIHLGTELEDVAQLIPEKLEESIEQIKVLNKRTINLNQKSRQHVFYKIVKSEPLK